jgi:hypothetical protein
MWPPQYTKTQKISVAATAVRDGQSSTPEALWHDLEAILAQFSNTRRNPHGAWFPVGREGAAYPDTAGFDVFRGASCHEHGDPSRRIKSLRAKSGSGEGRASGAITIRLVGTRGGDVRMRRDGPPRMAARSTWSGRERSSHSRFPPVPRVRLVTPLLRILWISCATHPVAALPAGRWTAAPAPRTAAQQTERSR